MPSCRKATTKTWGSWTDAVAVRGLATSAAVAMAAWYGAGSMPAADTPATEPDQVAVFMRAKLAHSQNVLEGLAVEDYDLIDKGAQQLSLASEAASWQVLQTEDYARHSADFRRSCDALRKAARDHNLDGAALAWMEVTMKCVQCHKYVRDVRREPTP
jgi:cytochrome c556